ncbi:mRNA-decapping enzyme 1A isoform X1 [Struthio camelus]|uniref:mRNA-decapping enzyme 1A isoform X1 n=1 Tax=Struthio camelus TaxID=8801 RepID=UPI003603E4AD
MAVGSTCTLPQTAVSSSGQSAPNKTRRRRAPKARGLFPGEGGGGGGRARSGAERSGAERNGTARRGAERQARGRRSGRRRGRVRRGRRAAVSCPPPRLLPGSKMESLSRAGQEISLAALKQHDPYITSIADVTGQVALYSFSPKANEWEKTDIEGTLFVYKRSASPYHGFTIVNRLNMHNLVEPVNKDLEFQLHEPFLLYRNASLSIYSIWFYDKNDCHRIAKLMAKVVEQEAQRSRQVCHDRKSPSRTNGCNENRPIDILEMLSKAKDEYERNQVSDLSIVSSSGMQQNANPPKPDSTEASEQATSLQMQDQPFQSRQKHLTLEELFGTSVPKEQAAVPYPTPERMETSQPDTSAREQRNLLLPFSFDQSTVIHQPLGKSESPGVKTSTSALNQQECLTPMLIPPASVSQSDVKNISNYSVHLSPVLNSASTMEAAPAQMLPGLKQNNSIMQVMQQAAKQISPLVNQLPSEVNHAPQNLMAGQSQFVPPLTSTNAGTVSNTSHTSVDLLQKLRLTPQHDQMQQQALTKTSLTPNTSASVGQLATPESFKESHSKPSTLNSKIISPLQTAQQNKESEPFSQPKSLPKASQVVPPQFVTTTTTVTPSILLSPSVFQQSATKTTEVENKAHSSSPLTLATTEIQTIPPTVLSRSQLQEALIHLIKNDSRFLSTIHEVYLQVLTKNTDNIKL